MPLWRYFAFTGGALLALLFLADWYLPKSAAEPARAGIDKTIIRIQSTRQWPEAIVFDTNRPAITPSLVTASLVTAEAAPAETPTVERPARDAFAQLAPTPPVRPAASAVVPRKVASRHHARTRTPVRRIASVQPMESRAAFPFAW
jgi:hypothetical protein